MKEETLAIGGTRCRALYSQRPGPPLLLLHGYSFTSDVWRDVGLLEALEEARVPFVAVDMPYGRASKCSPRTRSIDVNVEVARSACRAYFGDSPPVVLGASLGGYVAMHYALRYPALGLLLVSPVGSSELAGRLSSLKIPVKIVYGDRDEIVSLEELEGLAKSTGGELVVYEGAGHAAYLDRPEKFKKDVLDFYRSATGGT